MKVTCVVLIGVLLAGGASAQELRPPRPLVAPPLLYRLRGDALERYVERTVKASLGPWVDDVDVDVDERRCRVEVELCHPAGLGHLQRVLYSMPELAGYLIKIEVDWNEVRKMGLV